MNWWLLRGVLEREMLGGFFWSHVSFLISGGKDLVILLILTFDLFGRNDLLASLWRQQLFGGVLMLLVAQTDIKAICTIWNAAFRALNSLLFLLHPVGILLILKIEPKLRG